MYDTCGQGTPSRRHEALRDIIALKGKGARINAIRMADIGHHQHKVPNTWKACFSALACPAADPEIGPPSHSYYIAAAAD